jgi:hypothetical protein
MSDRSNLRRVAAFVFLAALLLAALMPGAAGLPLAFLIVAICFLVGTAPVVLLGCVSEDRRAQRAFALLAFSPRPPPAG